MRCRRTECQDLQTTRYLTRVMWREEVSLFYRYIHAYSQLIPVSHRMSLLLSHLYFWTTPSTILSSLLLLLFQVFPDIGIHAFCHDFSFVYIPLSFLYSLRMNQIVCVDDTELLIPLSPLK